MSKHPAKELHKDASKHLANRVAISSVIASFEPSKLCWQTAENSENPKHQRNGAPGMFLPCQFAHDKPEHSKGQSNKPQNPVLSWRPAMDPHGRYRQARERLDNMLQHPTKWTIFSSTRTH